MFKKYFLLIGIVALCMMFSLNTQTHVHATDVTRDDNDNEITQTSKTPEYSIDTKFDYSFTEQKSWMEVSRQDKLELCQIPIDKARKMTTEALLDSVLENPFMADLLAYNSIEKGYEVVKEEIVAFQVLLERDDLGRQLIKKYSMCNKGISDNEIMSSLYISSILAQPEIIKMTDEEDLSHFESSINSKDVSLYQTSVNEHTFNTDSITKATYSVATIWTPVGSHVQVGELTSADFTVAQQNSMHNDFSRIYSYQRYLKPASLAYNCHSYAFYSQSSTNPYWLNHPYVDAYMNDGSYYSVATPITDDRVHWHSGDHSGIIAYVGSQMGNTSVISKYGKYGVYQAFIGDVSAAYGSGSYTFWRR